MEREDSPTIIFFHLKRLKQILFHLSLVGVLIYMTDNFVEEVNAASFVTPSSSCNMETLIPSQAVGTTARGHDDKFRKTSPSSGFSKIIHSRVTVQAKTESKKNEEDEGGDDIVLNEQRLSKTKDKTKKDSQMKAASSDASLTNNYKTSNNRAQTKKKNKKGKIERSGNLPDIHWRAIPMDHLRLHPNFKALPLVEDIQHLSCMEDVRNFRQDSWQWDVLHFGRCTTSQAASALGFLEHNASSKLGIPRSLQHIGRRGNSAFHRLSQGQPLTTLDQMNQQLITPPSNNNKNEIESIDKSSTVWKNMKPSSESRAKNKFIGDNEKNCENIQEQRRQLQRPTYPFAAKYIPTVSKTDLKKRKNAANQYFAGKQNKSAMRARMSWGNTQEATSILTALNYLWKLNPDIIIEEVGMCGAGLEHNLTNFESQDKHKNLTKKVQLLVGASPDAIVRYPNGTLEALEVKNHCPFVNPRRNYGKKKGRMTIKDHNNFMIRTMELSPTVPAIYIPQLMMEMLCLGSSCTSVLMVRQTATNGAVILRLRRDNEWLDEMIYWLQRFVTDYVNTDQPPPADFFWKEKRYQDFIEKTKCIQKNNVELVDYVQHSSIQRTLANDKNDILPLFLDTV